MKHTNLFKLLIPILFIVSSCKKEAGEGGTSSITGKVYARYYNKNFSFLADSGYAPDADVYIIYGNEPTFGKRQRTTYDGSYKFNYLEKGSYTIYAYSKDSTGAYKNMVNQYAPDVPAIQKGVITKRKQTVELPDIEVAL